MDCKNAYYEQRWQEGYIIGEQQGLQRGHQNAVDTYDQRVTKLFADAMFAGYHKGYETAKGRYKQERDNYKQDKDHYKQKLREAQEEIKKLNEILKKTSKLVSASGRDSTRWKWSLFK